MGIPGNGSSTPKKAQSRHISPCQSPVQGVADRITSGKRTAVRGGANN